MRGDFSGMDDIFDVVGLVLEFDEGLGGREAQCGRIEGFVHDDCGLDCYFYCKLIKRNLQLNKKGIDFELITKIHK
jgi:hypothetical protein